MLLQLSSLMVTIKQSSAKDMAHQRQTGGKKATSVTFSDDMKLTMNMNVVRRSTINTNGGTEN